MFAVDIKTAENDVSRPLTVIPTIIISAVPDSC